MYVRNDTRTVYRKRVNFCVLKHLFLEGVEQPKKRLKPLRNALSDALLMSRFLNFVADAAKKNRAPRFFDTALCALLINELIQINSGPKILRSWFIHYSPKDCSARLWGDTTPDVLA